MKANYSESFKLSCPFCGKTSFSYDKTESGSFEDRHIFTCINCGRSITKAQIVAAHQHEIDECATAVTTEVFADIKATIEASIPDASGLLSFEVANAESVS